MKRPPWYLLIAPVRMPRSLRKLRQCVKDTPEITSKREGRTWNDVKNKSVRNTRCHAPESMPDIIHVEYQKRQTLEVDNADVGALMALDVTRINVEPVPWWHQCPEGGMKLPPSTTVPKRIRATDCDENHRMCNWQMAPSSGVQGNGHNKKLCPGIVHMVN